MKKISIRVLVYIFSAIFLFSFFYYSFVIYIDSRMNDEKEIIRELSRNIQSEQQELLRLLVFPYFPQLQKYKAARQISINQFNKIKDIKIIRLISKEATFSLDIIENIQLLKINKNPDFDEITASVNRFIIELYNIENPDNVEINSLYMTMGKKALDMDIQPVLKNATALVIYIQMLDKLLTSTELELNREFQNIEFQTNLIVRISQVVSLVIICLAIILIFIFTIVYTNERKKAQNLVRNILESIDSSLIVINQSGNVIVWNEDLANDRSISNMNAQGKSLSEIDSIFSLEMTRDIISRTVDKGEKWKKERLLSNKDLTNPVYKDISAFPLRDNEISGAVIRIDDITERILMEKVMIQSEKMISVGSLSAGIAHEINNPLAGILQSLQVMKNRLDLDSESNAAFLGEYNLNKENLMHFLTDRKIMQLMDLVQDSGKRAASIVKNMLSFARRSENIKTDQSLFELVDEAINLLDKDYNLNKKYDFKNIKIERDFQEDVPLFMCNRGEVEQVFLNIIKNSAQAMSEEDNDLKKDTIKIKISSSDNFISVEISDNGPGMSDDTKNKLFEPFYTTKKVGSGTGLGLYICYLIIKEQYRGDIEVESELGEGTLFHIKFPIFHS